MPERTAWQPGSPPRRGKRRRAGPGLLILFIGIVGAGLTPAVGDGGAAAETTGAAPLWPLDLPERHLTSNFMEYRSGRFHAGIDLKTRSRCGFPVRAVTDGWIRRLRAAPDGYGRAAYLQTADGRTYVYAHLERFADALRDRVRAVQERRRVYRVDFSLPPQDLPVRRGDVLGLSGQSGTAGPHLHFEVRNAAQEPLDPLAHGFAPRDSLPPRILKVRALPASPLSRVAGGLSALSLADADGLAGMLPPLRVHGPVAFTAAVQDAADAAGHVLEPWRLTVRLDGREVFALRNERFAFAASALMVLEWLEVAGVREHWLHLQPGDDLPGRAGGAWSLDAGVLTGGRHRVELEAADRGGNTSRVAWELIVEEAPGASSAERSTADGGWAVDPLRLALPADAGRERWLTPFLEIVREAGGEESAGPPAGAEPCAAAGGDPLAWPGVGARRWRLAAGPARGILAPVTLWAVPDTLDGAVRRRLGDEQGLEALGQAARFLAAGWAVAGGLDVALPGWAAAAAEDPAVGLYREDGDGAWSLVGRPETGPEGGAGAWVWPLPGPGRYAVLRDGEPPRLGARGDRLETWAAGVRDSSGVGMPRWERLAVPARDRGAGLEPDSCRVSVDGRWLPAEPDPPRDRLLVELPDDLPPGEHELEVRVVDRAGLATRRRWILICREGPASWVGPAAGTERR